VKMRVHGQFDEDGEFHPYMQPWDGVIFGGTIRDPFDGQVLAIKDEYGEWVSPTMRSVGIRRRLKVSEISDSAGVAHGDG